MLHNGDLRSELVVVEDELGRPGGGGTRAGLLRFVTIHDAIINTPTTAPPEKRISSGLNDFKRARRNTTIAIPSKIRGAIAL